MREGWEVVTLKDVALIRTGKVDVNSGNPEGEYPFFTCANAHTYSDIYAFDCEATLIAGNGDVGQSSYYNGKFQAYQRTYVLSNFKRVSAPYLKYVIDAKLIPHLTEHTHGTAIPYIKKGGLSSCPVPLPPLSVQREIVERLDAAFELIDQARANVERCVGLAGEVWEGVLEGLLTPKQDWTTVKFEAAFKLKSGDNLTTKNMIPGPFPVYGGNAQAGTHEKYNLQGPVAIVGRVGALCGNARFIEEAIWLTDNAFQVLPRKPMDAGFTALLLNNLNLRQYARQAAQPVISNSSLKDIMVVYPMDVNLQAKIYRKALDIKAQLKYLTSISNERLQCLDEAKKSLLDRTLKSR